MEVKLEQKPKKPVIIEGFPGFGLIGTITTEFLIEQLKAEPIGNVKIKEMPAMAAIHDKKLVQPIGIFYAKKQNLVILHVITPVQGLEWDMADMIVKLAEDLQAKEVMSIEGVASPFESEETQCFYYCNDAMRKKQFEKLGIQALKEGIILGVSGALMLQIGEKFPTSFVFVEAHSTLPDSKAAVKIIETLNHYLNLDIETKPLMQQAEKFEEKLKGILEQSKHAQDEQQRKRLSYVG